MPELGWINKITKVSLLPSHLALPREGHLEAAVHLMVYDGQKYNSRLLYDPTYPDIDYSGFKNCDWSEFYQSTKEAIPVHHGGKRKKIMQKIRYLIDQEVTS